MAGSSRQIVISATSGGTIKCNCSIAGFGNVGCIFALRWWATLNFLTLQKKEYLLVRTSECSAAETQKLLEIVEVYLAVTSESWR
jgi:hypothetical protein